ncbi:response regulator transcription factor [Paenibacillus sinopodophylli]|uniref:response regulator transcription factor n=1 Tax=Paenibacillus sinopodophylli TaxID=1837342 RepID=UPI00110CCBD0|nr:response regulator [Paenibacillus sinopodophylli]
MYTVVLVDDEMGIIEGLQVIMKRYLPECQVIGTANDGGDGYDIVLELCPDLVITDIRMLSMDGLEMVERLVNRGSNSKFILLTGYSEFEYARKGIYLGVKFYLNKPIEEEELQQCVRKVIKEIETEKTRTGIQVANALGENGDSGEFDAVSKKKDVISEIKQYVFDNYNQNISLSELSNRFYLNLHYISRLFKEKTGQTYLEYVTMVRIERSKELLLKSDLRIYEVCQKVGYSDLKNFTKVFEKLSGCKPSEYRRMNQK